MGKFADWFYRWTEPFSEEQMDRIMEIETGGMLEEWVRLGKLTQEHCVVYNLMRLAEFLFTYTGDENMKIFVN